MSKSQQQSILFQATTSYGNRVLNFRQRPEDEFDLYASAYHRAARTLAEAVIAEYRNDLEVCPLVFLYRHSLELYLKAIIRIGAPLLQMTGITLVGQDLLPTGHQLSTLLPSVKRIFDHVGWTWELDIVGMRTFDEFVGLVQGLEQVDSGSYTFRYPTTMKEEAALPPHFTINVPHFCATMDQILESWEAATNALREIQQQALTIAAQEDADQANGAN